MLKICCRDKLIRENINDLLDKREDEDAKREFLTLEELKLLAEIPCEIPILAYFKKISYHVIYSVFIACEN